MYLRCRNVIFILIAICLASSTAYTQQKYSELLKSKKPNIYRNKRESETKQNDLKDLGLNLIHFIGKDFLPNTSASNILNISYSNNEKAIELLKDSIQTKENEAKENNIKELDSNLSGIQMKNILPSTWALSYGNNEDAFGILKDVIKTEVLNKTNGKDPNKYSNGDEGVKNLNENFTTKTELSEDTETPTVPGITNDEKSSSTESSTIDPLKDFIKTEVKNKNNSSEFNDSQKSDENVENFNESFTTVTELSANAETSTVSSITDDNNSSSTEIILTELINLSYSDVEELAVGQKIDIKRSSINSDTEDTNAAGVEILKNISTTCGSLFGKRISFANQTTLMEFPWTALLLYNTKIRFHCGGSLITSKYVLTAAHCVAQEFYELVGVRLGEHDVTEDPDCAPDLVGELICAMTVDAEVVKIVIHHAYSHLSFKNDIALLKLDKEYYTRSYYPICLTSPHMMYRDKQATVAGWGATEKTIRSAVLLKADVPLLDISKCGEIYRYSVFNDTTEICGSGTNEIDVCKGDSGGALFHRENVKGKDKFYQLGIISLGVRRCGDTRFLPAVFTKISAFYKWIENNLEY